MKLGFIGVGYMGRHMARNLVKAGHDLTVFDMRREAATELMRLGAKWVDSPSAVSETNDIVFTSLPRPQDVEEVVTGEGGVLAGATKGTILFDLSTTDPETIRKIELQGKAKGVSILDAPVSGGTGGAENGTLCVMVGGDKTIYDRYESILSTIGDKVMYCGPIGCGAICKIMNNFVSLSVSVLLSEVFTLGIKAGVSPQTLFEAISRSSGDTQSMKGLPSGLFKGNFKPGFQLDLAAKDIGLATDMGRKLRVPMEIGNIVQQRYIDGQNRGWGRLGAGIVARIQEERSEVEVREE